MRRLRLTQNPRHQTLADLLSLAILGVLVGLIDLGIILPVHADKKNSRMAKPEASDPSLLVKELAQLQAQINKQAKYVTLEEAISTGIRANPQLLQAFGAIQQYEWQLIAAQRQWYPTIQLSNGIPFAGIQWSSFSQNYSSSSPTAPPQDSNSSLLFALQPGVNITWNAIDPTRQPNINAASQSLKQQKFLFDVSTRSLILNIQQSYYALQSSQQLINSFRRIYEINVQQLAMIEAQRSIGMTTILDVESTRSQLFAQLNQLVGYTQSYIDQSASLAEDMALPEGVLAAPSEPAALMGNWTLPLPETIDKARRQREEILASLAAAEAARWSGVAAMRSYLPAFQLVGTGSLIANSGQQRNTGFNDSSTNIITRTTSMGVGFTWSIFDGGIQAANAQAADAQARLQAAQANSLQLQAMQEVRSSYGQLLTSRVALRSAQQAYRSAEIAQEAARARFAVGVGDITSVVQTIQQLSQASQQVSEAILSYNTALAQLYRYTAIWPPHTQSEVQQQFQSLRRSPVAASMPAQP
jgi:outer membrane protein TolC